MFKKIVVILLITVGINAYIDNIFWLRRGNKNILLIGDAHLPTNEIQDNNLALEILERKFQADPRVAASGLSKEDLFRRVGEGLPIQGLTKKIEIPGFDPKNINKVDKLQTDLLTSFFDKLSKANEESKLILEHVSEEMVQQNYKRLQLDLDPISLIAASDYANAMKGRSGNLEIILGDERRQIGGGNVDKFRDMADIFIKTVNMVFEEGKGQHEIMARLGLTQVPLEAFLKDRVFPDLFKKLRDISEKNKLMTTLGEVINGLNEFIKKIENFAKNINPAENPKAIQYTNKVIARLKAARDKLQGLGDPKTQIFTLLWNKLYRDASVRNLNVFIDSIIDEPLVVDLADIGFLMHIIGQRDVNYFILYGGREHISNLKNVLLSDGFAIVKELGEKPAGGESLNEILVPPINPAEVKAVFDQFVDSIAAGGAAEEKESEEEALLRALALSRGEVI